MMEDVRVKLNPGLPWQKLRSTRRILTNDGRCTCEIKSRIAKAKAAFNKKKTLFTSKLD